MSARTQQSEADAVHVAVVLLSIPFWIAFNGWALKTVWNWFVPQVTGWPRVGVAQAIGLAIVIGVARPQRNRERNQPWGEFWYDLLLHVFLVLVTLGIGFIVHEVMA